ncbi:C-C motif chemokine 19 [Alligator sinensis]|uniref:C-C motif chemokine 19 n=1 Tax=Alligator sinensis TaxID=38654 RepID=A0A1U7RNN3_ALLSI|nr:C-C motif chemokine 19 [Alligator sinensis]
MALLGLAILALCALLPARGSSNALDCCLRTSAVPIPARIVLRYEEQLALEGCPVEATVFLTVRSRRLCAPPHLHWVRHLREKLDRRHGGKRWSV